MVLGGVRGISEPLQPALPISPKEGRTKRGRESKRIRGPLGPRISTTNPGATLDVNRISLIRNDVFSYSTDFYYTAATPTWTPGDQSTWTWGGTCFLITFIGTTVVNTYDVCAAFIVFHSRGDPLVILILLLHPYTITM